MSSVESIYPLSPLQLGLLYHSINTPNEPTYFEQISCKIMGELNVNSFQQAWDWVVARHPILRTAFIWKEVEEPLQVVGRKVNSPLILLDWTMHNRKEQYAKWNQLLSQDKIACFDFSKAPLMRFYLAKINGQEWWFIWSHHHILLDGWSFGIVFDEMLSAYESLTKNKLLPNKKVPRPYREYIAFLKQYDDKQATQFWKTYLANLYSPTRLLVDNGFGVQEGGGKPEITLSDYVTPEIMQRLNAIVAKQGITLSTIVHAAWAKVIAVYSGHHDVVFGSTFSGRPPHLQGVENMVGLFINTVPFRIKLDNQQSVIEWLRSIQHDFLTAQEHQHIGLANIQTLSSIPRGMSLFETLLSFQNYPLDQGILQGSAGISFSDFSWFGPTNYPLSARAFPGEQLMLVISYYPHRISDAIAKDMLDLFKEVIIAIALNVNQKLSQLPTVSQKAVSQLIEAWNATDKPFDEEIHLHGKFEQIARQYPNNIAVIAGDDELTYAELNIKANQLANYLLKRNIKPGDRVGICAEKSAAFVVGIMGILKIGATFVPLDPDYPVERLQFMISDAKLSGVLTFGKGNALMSQSTLTTISLDNDKQTIANESIEAPNIITSATHFAYMIYTSGSSGKPKGVLLDHRGRINNFMDYIYRYQMGSKDRLLNVSSLSFDMTAHNIFCMLMSGGCLVMPCGGQEKNITHWLELIVDKNVTIWHSVPVLMGALIDSLSSPLNAKLRLAILGGDWIDVALPDRARAAFPGLKCVSAGGATELSVDSVIYDIEEVDPYWKSIPYGKPMKNQSALILDEDLNLVPVGVPGELHLGGVGLAAGYFDRPDLTAEKFIPHPFARQPGERLYKTGDLAKFLTDGTIELLGRIDFQVKIRGMRIELGEIEATLRVHPEVKDCIVCVKTDNTGDKYLVGYVATDQQDIADLKQYLLAKLPAYMVPYTFVFLDQLPLTPNGKKDRRNLPEIQRDTSQRINPPATECEREIAMHWEKILGIPCNEMDVHTSFFDLGGNSLKALRACQLPHHTIRVQDLYQYPSISTLAKYLDSQQATKKTLLVKLNSQTCDTAVICVPYGGANPAVYHELAKQLEGVASVYAVDLPGHDINAAPEELQGLHEIVKQIVNEVSQLSQPQLSIYGHCAGVAIALELALQLEKRNQPIQSVFLGASYPLKQAINVDPFTHVSDIELADQFVKLGGFHDLSENELQQLGRLLRHDGKCSRNYFSERMRYPQPKLKARLTCIIGKADPLTLDYQTGYKNWLDHADQLDLRLVETGHYFINTEADKVAGYISQSFRLTQ